MKLGLLQPNASWVQFEMARGANQRKRRVRQRKTRIARHCRAQVPRRFFQMRRIARRAEPVPAHEFRISKWVLAMPWAAIHRGEMQRAVQRARDLLSGLV